MFAASIHHLVDFCNEKEETGQQTESHTYCEFQFINLIHLLLEQEKLKQKWNQVKQKENPKLNHEYDERGSIHLVNQATDRCESLNQMMIFLYGLEQDVTQVKVREGWGFCGLAQIQIVLSKLLCQDAWLKVQQKVLHLDSLWLF